MRILFDFMPIILFYVAYQLYDIYVATAVAIVASVVQVAVFWWKYRRFESLHLLTLFFVVVLGGATLWLQDEASIKWKPTAVNWIFAVIFIASHFIGEGKPLLERFFGNTIDMPRKMWLKLSYYWALFFAAVGVLNLYIAYNFSTDVWANFKMFGMLGLSMAFIIAQSFYMLPYIKKQAVEEKEE